MTRSVSGRLMPGSISATQASHSETSGSSPKAMEKSSLQRFSSLPAQIAPEAAAKRGAPEPGSNREPMKLMKLSGRSFA